MGSLKFELKTDILQVFKICSGSSKQIAYSALFRELKIERLNSTYTRNSTPKSPTCASKFQLPPNYCQGLVNRSLQSTSDITHQFLPEFPTFLKKKVLYLHHYKSWLLYCLHFDLIRRYQRGIEIILNKVNIRYQSWAKTILSRLYDEWIRQSWSLGFGESRSLVDPRLKINSLTPNFSHNLGLNYHLSRYPGPIP